MDDVLALHSEVENYYRMVFDAHRFRKANILISAKPRSEAITHLFRKMRSRHLCKLSEKQLDPLICTLFPDILAGYRRVKDHLLNIAEADAEEIRGEIPALALAGIET